MRTLIRRLHYLLNRRKFDQELANDLEFHREMAASQGHIPLGNSLQIREEARDSWGWTWIDRLGQDLRYAARMLRQSPMFTLTAILILAIGIGINIAVFGFFNLVTLRPMNVSEPDSLLRFHRRSVNQYAFAVPYPEAAFFRENTRTLSAVIAVNRTNVFFEKEEKPVEGSFVTANFFQELGGSSIIGRVLDVQRDEAPDSDPVIVLSYGFWQHQFGGDPQVIGKTVQINNKFSTVIGVASRSFIGVGIGMREPAFWAPIIQQPYFSNGSSLLTDMSVESPGVNLWGRLQKDMSPAATEDELALLAAELRKQYSTDIWEQERLISEPGGYVTSMMTGNRRGTGTEQREPIYPVFAWTATLTLLILVVSCSNLGSMLLARGVARQREIGIRIAIGADRARIVRQLFTESLLLGLLGSAAGLILEMLLLHGLLTVMDAPSWIDSSPDWRIIAFSLFMGFTSALLFGLAPAFQPGRQPHKTQRARQTLIGIQVAGSCVLLIVTGLLVRALNQATSQSPGFEYQQVVSIDPGISNNGSKPAQARTHMETLKNQLQEIPGVQSISFALNPPLGRRTMTAGVEVNGHHISFQLNHVSPEFFQTMNIPILRGRTFQNNERQVAVISAALARQAWPGEDPVGKIITLGQAFTIIGISGNIRSVKFGETDTVHAYFPIEEDHWSSLSVLMKTSDSVQNLAGTAMIAARRAAPDSFPTVQLLHNSFRTSLEGAEFSTVAVSVLSFISQLLACFGIVGVVSYSVVQRSKEIGIRMALGAQHAHILTIVLRQLLLPISIGLIAGIMGAAGLSQILQGRLYGLSHLDAGAYLGAILFFIVTIVIAAILPAQKALRVDPIRVLHQL